LTKGDTVDLVIREANGERNSLKEPVPQSSRGTGFVPKR